MKTYKEELLKVLSNIDGYLESEYELLLNFPASPQNAFHESLSFAESEDYGHRILALIIFHQISIELIKRLLPYTNFLEKLCLYPNKIEFKSFNKESQYSKILEELKFKVEFSKKKHLIKKLGDLNNLRTKYAHFIAQDDSLYYPEETAEFSELFNEIFSLFTNALLDLRKRIDQAIQRPEILKILKQDEQNQ